MQGNVHFPLSFDFVVARISVVGQFCVREDLLVMRGRTDSGSYASSTFLDRQTESDAMVVEVGSCSLADPNFCNAAVR